MGAVFRLVPMTVPAHWYLPFTGPELVWQTQGLPEVPLLSAQHHPLGMMQMAPGAVGCATDCPAKSIAAARQKARALTAIRLMRPLQNSVDAATFAILHKVSQFNN